jgi:hypothetical protein
MGLVGSYQESEVHQAGRQRLGHPPVLLATTHVVGNSRLTGFVYDSMITPGIPWHGIPAYLTGRVIITGFEFGFSQFVSRPKSQPVTGGDTGTCG